MCAFHRHRVAKHSVYIHDCTRHDNTSGHENNAPKQTDSAKKAYFHSLALSTFHIHTQCVCSSTIHLRVARSRLANLPTTHFSSLRSIRSGVLSRNSLPHSCLATICMRLLYNGHNIASHRPVSFFLLWSRFSSAYSHATAVNIRLRSKTRVREAILFHVPQFASASLMLRPTRV